MKIFRGAAWLVAAALLCGRAHPSAAQQQLAPADLSSIVARAEALRAEWKIPGLTISIVQDGKIVLAQGLGVTRLGSQQPVTDRTLFTIASISKTFTGLAIGILVDRGLLTWDTRVQDVLPWFRLNDPRIGVDVTIRDLLSHRTGIENWDIIAASECDQSGDCPEQTIEQRRAFYAKLREARAIAQFREKSLYHDFFIGLLGQVVSEVSGQKWEDFVQANILNKVGMSHAYPNLLRVTDPGLVAAFHYLENDGTVKPDSDLRRGAFSFANSAAAGGMAVSSGDMAAYMIMRLRKGLSGDTRVISEATLATIDRATAPREARFTWSEPDAVGDFYGLGIQVSSYKGHKLLVHGGSNRAHRSILMMAPGLNFGVFVSVNLRQAGAVPNALAIYALSRILGVDPPDLTTRALEEVKRDLENRRKEAAPPAGVAAALGPEAYAGDYQLPFYGTMRVERDGGDLWMRFFLPNDKYRARLVPLGGHAFAMADWNEPMADYRALNRLAFLVDENDRVSGFTFKSARLGSIVYTTSGAFQMSDDPIVAKRSSGR